MKKIIALIMAISVTLFSTNIYAAEGDIVDIASNNADFSILVQALSQANLVEALQGSGPFTVFAPTDAAFATLLTDLNISAEDLLNHPDLSKVLLYHVVSGQVLSTDLTDGQMAETLNGNSITIDLMDGVKVDQAKVVTADIMATNGVIHVIDQVIIPPDFVLNQQAAEEAKPDIVDIALSDSSFSMLVMLLQKANLVEALQAEGPYTVFAPTNDAFNDLLETLDITPEELMAQPGLADVLLYHVVGSKVMSSDLEDGLMASTLSGEAVKFDLNGGVKVNGANVVAADVEASNGVVHIIDAVLIPQGFVLETVDIVEEEVPKTGDPATWMTFGILFASTAALGIAKRKLK